MRDRNKFISKLKRNNMVIKLNFLALPYVDVDKYPNTYYRKCICTFLLFNIRKYLGEN